MRAHTTLPFLLCCLMSVNTACTSEARLGPCRFLQADVTVKLEEDLMFLDVVKHATEQDAIYVLDYGDVDHAARTMSAARIDARTGQMTKASLRIDDYNRLIDDFKDFEPDRQFGKSYPMFRTGFLRYDYVGRRWRHKFFQRSLEGKWSIEDEPRFTGTRRLLYGTRLLLEQEIVDGRELGEAYEHVQIEPNGDRIVAMCSEPAYTWIGVFSRSKLDAAVKQPKR